MNLQTQTMTEIDVRIVQAVQAASALAGCEQIIFSTDAKTDQACRAYLKTQINESALRKKVALELGNHVWRPLGRLLLIVSENDVLGSAQAFLGAFITANRVLVKARSALEILHFLKKSLALDDEVMQIIDWQGGTQDDAILLQDVDGIVLAGGVDLITHFRRVTPPRIRLIEFGPKISAAAIGRVDLKDVPQITSLLVDEVVLFLQQVCSSPRFILVEQEDVAHALFHDLKQRLSELPALSEVTRLAQSAKYAELRLMQRIRQDHAMGLQDIAFESDNGWGVTLSKSLNSALWLDKGFQLVSGGVEKHLAQARQQWRGALQTLGTFACHDLPLLGFTRFCPLGEMHRRPLSVPHDGFFEFASLVSFISQE